MARVTVEDCVIKIPNRFELVMLAAQRAREIASGAAITLDRDDDKNPVVALREIAEDRVIPSILQESLVKGLQKHVEHDEPEEDSDVIIGEESWPLGAGGQAIASELEEDMSVEGEGEGEAEIDDLDEDAVIPDFAELGEEPERE